jgi:hypothetical protein
MAARIRKRYASGGLTRPDSIALSQSRFMPIPKYTPAAPGSAHPPASGRSALRWVLSTAALVLAPLSAHAQIANLSLLDQYFQPGVPGYGQAPGVTVLSRSRPDYDPLGVRVGDFVIRPEVNEGIGFNSNVLGTSPAKGSFDIDSQGSVRVNSDWGRNSLGGEITVDDRRLPSESIENRTDWSGTLGGTYEFGRDVLTIAGSHFSLHQDPTGIDAQQFTVPGLFTTNPIPYTLDDVRASYAATFGRFGLTPDVDYERLRFSSLKLIGLNGVAVPAPVGGTIAGVPISQSYRDRDILEGGVTGRYEFAPLRDALLVVRDVNTNYNSSQAAAFGPSRSSNAVEVLAGLDYVADAVWRYRALIGYESRDFDSRQYKTHAAPIVEANVIWQPTGLTTVTGRLLRTIEDAADESVSGYDYTSARLSVDHEYARNILLSGYLGAQRADYLQTTNNETYYGAGAGVTWLVNRNVRLTATDDVTQRESSSNFGPNYFQNVTMLQIRLGL